MAQLHLMNLVKMTWSLLLSHKVRNLRNLRLITHVAVINQTIQVVAPKTDLVYPIPYPSATTGNPTLADPTTGYATTSNPTTGSPTTGSSSTGKSNDFKKCVELNITNLFSANICTQLAIIDCDVVGTISGKHNTEY